VRFFITGIGGFVGVHLAEALLAAGHDVRGTVTGRRDRPALRVLAARHPRFDPTALACVDVGDRPGLARAVADAAPDGVFHLAGIAFAPAAAADWERAFAVNVLGTMHVLDAVHTAAPGSRVLAVTSSDVYGVTEPGELPIVEETPLRPASVYGVSKAAADLAAFRAWWETGLAVVRVRAFNHTGPGQSPDFVCSAFARQIARIEAGASPAALHVGNLEVERDFSDVRDIVRGYVLLWERGAPGEVYNLCSGVATRVGAIVDLLVAESSRRIDVVTDPARLRRREIETIVGSAARAAALGWSPGIPLAQTLRDLLNDWRRQVVRA
jgi:GDP-4-dehydro-6-deoxy-D-mannose reductase